MRQHEKSPAGVGAPSQATETGPAMQTDTASNCDCTTSIREAQAKIVSTLIYDRLGCGANEGKSLQQLTQETGKDPREVRRQISRERKAGKLIMSDNQNGYFRPASEYDVQRFIRSMAHRSKEIEAASRAAEEALSSMSGQEHMEGW